MQNYPELMEIRICLDKNNLNPTGCLGLNHVHIGRECGDTDNPMIMYPPITYNINIHV